MAQIGTQPDTGFFAELDPADRTALTELSRRRRFPAGSTLMFAGQVGTEVMVLVAGRVKVTYLTEDGREAILDFRGPGELLGELAVLDGSHRSNTIQAIEAVDALTMSAAEFKTLVARSPTLANTLLQHVIRRSKDSDRKLVEFGASHTVGRVAARLLEMVERFGKVTDVGHVIDLPITQEELAGWTGASREAVAKALHALRESGLIATERRRFTVLDLEGLERRCR
jgi:CRP/FNR family cyclic AMP-dependent transcriptional regulator